MILNVKFGFVPVYLHSVYCTPFKRTSVEFSDTCSWFKVRISGTTDDIQSDSLFNQTEGGPEIFRSTCWTSGADLSIILRALVVPIKYGILVNHWSVYHTKKRYQS